MTNQHEILGGLNEEQRAAVEQLTGPLLVLAGAGSGKTRVLTSRIAWAIACGQVHPGEVFAVTFTNKAAASMRERASRLAGMDFSRLWVRTFHAACAVILRIEHEFIGLPSAYTIYDQDDQTALVRAIIRDEKLPVDTKHSSDLVQLIQRNKDRLLPPDAEAGLYAGKYDEDVVAYLYALYNKRLRAQAALDFGDLIMETVHLFNTHDEVRARYAERFRFILVDEFQDTNIAQYALLHILARDHQNICVVGDDDQSIYSWRGAEAGNFNAFMRDFRDPKVIRLEQNYRSAPEILRVAASVIAHNAARMRKEIWSDLEAGDLPFVAAFAKDREEADWTARKIQRLLFDDEAADDIAVLYRANWQSRILETALLHLKIPYRIVGSVEFYKRKEVRDLRSWLRVMVNPYDGNAFARLMQSPPRGIGEKTISMLSAASMEHGLDLVAICADAEKYLPKRAQKKAGELRKVAQLIRSFDVKCDLARQLKSFAEECGIYAMYEDELERIENLEELITDIANWEELHPGQDLNEYIIHASLRSEVEQGGALASERVQLMTVHNAKGLEFKHVFLTGMEEGIFPSYHSLEDAEEERRLFYVAVTRAKRVLTISYAQARRSFTGESIRKQSRFLEEIPPELAEWQTFGELIDTSASGQGRGNGYPGGGHFAPRSSAPGKFAAPKSPAPGKFAAPKSPAPGKFAAPKSPAFGQDAARAAKTPAAKMTFPEGCLVRHKEYGEGLVLERTDKGGGLFQVRVEFADRTCTFIELYAPLEKLF